jgi:hypothetical protein
MYKDSKVSNFYSDYCFRDSLRKGKKAVAQIYNRNKREGQSEKSRKAFSPDAGINSGQNK